MKMSECLYPHRRSRRVWMGSLVAMALIGLLPGCSMPPAPSKPSAERRPPVDSGSERPTSTAVSNAQTAKDYRRDAASHLYALQHNRIYKGRLPAMLYAVGVLNVDIDRHGQVKGIHWMRAPRHAPEVMSEIETMVRSAAPYPAPRHMTQVTYTDVWLWHKSGRFQLDTLTEGQD